MDYVSYSEYWSPLKTTIAIETAGVEDLGQCVKLLCSEFNADKKRQLYYTRRILNGDCIMAKTSQDTVAALVIVSEKSDTYDGAEIDFAVVQEVYRHYGLMTRLFKTAIGMLGNKDIFVRCWYTDGDVHLRHALDKYGFELLQKDVRIYDQRYMFEAYCHNCPHCRVGCRCGSDLYYRKGTKRDN